MIGARVARSEDPRFLRGHGRFVDDVQPAGALHAAVLRSPHARARLLGIDAAPARTLPGVHLVLTAQDLGDLNQPGPLLIPHPALTHPRTQRPLAAGEVRFVGEAVAFVVADSRYLAEDAAALIEVAYEPLPAVVDPEAALDPHAPRVHGDVPRTAPRVSRRRSAIRRAPFAMRRTSCASGWSSSGAAGARSRAAGWWRSTIRARASCASGIPPRPP